MHLTPVDDDAPAHAGCRLLLFVGPELRPDASISALLARQGWRSVWLAGAQGAIGAAAHARFDAVIVQAERDGGPPSRHIAAMSQALGCPLIVVAGEADDIDEIIALEFGADAYLGGGLVARRLLAHLQALLRREQRDDDGPATPVRNSAAPMRLGAWTLDEASRRLQAGERHVALTAVQTAVLGCLGRRSGQVVAREELQRALAGERALHERSVDVYVARLRRRLREQRVDGLQIEGVRGVGYALEVDSGRALSHPLMRWAARSAEPWVARTAAT